MTRVEQLEQEIAKLSPDEFAQLRDWLFEQDWAEWDRQIERDAADGMLDGLMKQALADHAAGKTRPRPPHSEGLLNPEYRLPHQPGATLPHASRRAPGCTVQPRFKFELQHRRRLG